MTATHASDLAALAAGYDDVPYRTMARRTTHPVDMATQAHLFGIAAADPRTARVLEVGCGDGMNLLPMAESLPGARFVGIDLAAAPIARARDAAAQVGLTNVEFVQCDLAALPAEVAGPFDYVVAHGVYSWVPSHVRDSLMSMLAQVLATDGVAFVSYNCYPGSFARDAIRDAVRFALPDDLPIAQRVVEARRLLRVLAAGRDIASHGDDVARHAARLLERDDWSLVHDELSPWCDAVYLHEFVDHAARHGLAWLFEARLSDGVQLDVPGDVRASLEELPADVVVREQYLDLMRGRMFRESLLRRAPVEPARTLRAAAIGDCWVSGRGERHADAPSRFTFESGLQVTIADDLLGDVVEQVLVAWPATVPVTELCEGLDAGTAGQLLDLLARLHAVDTLRVRVAPVRTTRAGDRPRVSPLARWQAGAGMSHVASSTHDPIAIEDDLGRRLLTLLDGTRDLAELTAAFPEVSDAQTLVAASLDALERAGMFVAYD